MTHRSPRRSLQVALAVATLLPAWLASAPLESPGDSAEALTARARETWEQRTPAALLRSAELFEAAASAYPDHAPAHAGLADAYALLGLYAVLPPGDSLPRARRAAQRALEIDPELAAAHASLGLAQYLYDWDYAAARRSLEAAVELSPGYASAHHWYAMLLAATGRPDEAVERMSLALRAAPASRVINVKIATVLAAAGRVEEAETALEEAERRYPELPLVHSERGFLSMKQGRYAEAVGAFTRAAELAGPGSKPQGALGYALARSGQRERAQAIARDLVQLADRQYVPRMGLALVHAGLGDRDAAFEQLERAYLEREPGLVYLAIKPGVRELRGDPRFEDLVERLGLPTNP